MTERQCAQCRTRKKLQAFIGQREVCRVCWIDLPKDMQTKLVKFAKIVSKKIHQGNWEDRKKRKERGETLSNPMT